MENSAIIKTFMLISMLALFDRVLSSTHKYEAIFNFGDSLSDTGNRLRTSSEHNFTGELPNGITFGKHSGRSSDGRLIIDFIAEELGLEYLPPYLELKQGPYVTTGVNFAVAGATALDTDILKKKMEPLQFPIFSNQSLSVQLSWFKDWTSKCTSQADCKEYFKKSLFVVGIGGNDYNYPLIVNATDKQTENLVPLVTERIAKAIVELINEAGAINFLVPGVMVSSCGGWPLDKPVFISHNQALQQTLENVRNAHPHVNITYADYYGAAMVFYRDPKRYGFTNGATDNCCTPKHHCGSRGSKACPNPSEFVCWDGAHLTEAAYKIMANGLMHANFTSSSLNNTGPFL